MRVAVIGATGFIGRRIVARLLAEGHAPVAVVRDPAAARRRFPTVPARRIDLARDRAPALWREALGDVDAVVNAAGVLERDAAAVHFGGGKALFQACRTLGVRRIVHISALGVDRSIDAKFAQTKLAADKALMAVDDLDWTILRPSLVYGPGAYGGTALLRGLAACPGVTFLPGDGEQQASPIWIDDLASTVSAVLADDRHVGAVLQPAGPETVSLREYLRRMRAWLDLPPAFALPVPMPVIDLTAHIGRWLRLGPLNPTSIAMLQAGVAADGAAFADAIGFRPLSMKQALALHPASGQDKQAARIYFLRWLAWPVAAGALIGAAAWALGAGPWLLAAAGGGAVALLAGYVWLTADDK